MRLQKKYERAVGAAGAGGCGVALAFASAYSAYEGVVSGMQALPGDASQVLLQYLLLLMVPPFFSAVGGALVALALEVTGWRTLVISLAAFLIGFAFALLMARWYPYHGPDETVFSFLATAYLAMIFLIVVVAVPAFGSLPTGRAGLAATATIASLLLLATLLSGRDQTAIAAAILAWIMLPVITVLTSSTPESRNA